MAILTTGLPVALPAYLLRRLRRLAGSASVPVDVELPRGPEEARQLVLRD